MMQQANVARADLRIAPPKNLKLLQGEISARYKDLSRRLQQVGRFVLDHPTETALETVTVLAERAGVQPSAVVRFAQNFGFSGFREMQRVFMAPIAASSTDHPQRLRAFEDRALATHEDQSGRILAQVCSVNAKSIESLNSTVDRERLDQAVQLLARARHVYVVGNDQCFGIAAYLACLLPSVERPAHLVTGLGGMMQQQTKAMTSRDALVAIAFAPYSSDTLSVAAAAVERKTPVIAISDSIVSPLAQGSILLEARDSEFQGTRSMTAALCLAQAIVLAVGAERD